MSMIEKQIEELKMTSDMVIDYFSNIDMNFGLCIKDRIDNAIDTIQKLSAKLSESNLNDGWIPCSERLPEYSGWYFVTAIYKDVDTTDRIFWNLKEWLTNDLQPLKEYNSEIEITAWQPLPQPYKEKF